MAASVEITLIICGTVVLIFLVAPFLPEAGRRRWREGHDRYGKYQMLLGALSDLAADVGNRRAWQRFSQAANAVSLVAPQSVVAVVMECQEEMRRSGAPLSDAGAKRLILELRRDLGLPFRDDSALFQFRVVPSSMVKDSG